jgi:hypothetical protein
MDNAQNCGSFIDRHNPIDRINLLGLYRRRDVFPVRYEEHPSCILNKRQDNG